MSLYNDELLAKIEGRVNTLENQVDALSHAILTITRALQSPMGGFAVNEVVNALKDADLVEKKTA